MRATAIPRVRHWLARRGMDAVVPKRSDEVERRVGWINEFRRVGTRFNKLAGSFMAFVRLALIQRHLRLLDPSDRT